jgi:CheY-like chemotaxis protein
VEKLPDDRRKKILIVEDEESNYELLKAILRKLHLEIFWALNGKQAIDLCEMHSFELILMDIKMPEMNGYDALKILRKRGIDTPVIAQTAYARIEDEDAMLKMGFSAYISKPIDRNKLFEIIESYVSWQG